jgi:hypothetical protein
MSKECRDCRFWAFDMDMDAFCTHPNSSEVGTCTNTMRGTKRSPHMRGAPCGPEAKFFEPSKRNAA